ncbi:hypothetical protein [Parafilimonas sp.]|uniref:hypothetical protein n=1 Tax=Parafilimonas sp. TaxID=1969739 RepID=UPI0039E25732
MQFNSRLFIVLLLLVISNELYAQSVKFYLKGTVKDTAGNTIGFATVSIINKSSGAGIFFTQTNENGFYSFLINDSNILKENLAVTVDAIGYLRAEKNISDWSAGFNFVLNADENFLTPVTVTDNSPRIKKSGDTLNYRVTDFANKNDKVIGDVIKKLPGIEVDDNGVIKYNGKAINKFYIEGDNLLDDKYTMGTKTIPADIVDKVQVIENNQDIKLLNGIVTTDRAAINITLKDKDKLRFINSAKGGVGSRGAYKGEANSLAFKNKFKAINAFKINNVGEDLRDEIASHNLNDFPDDNQPQLLTNNPVYPQEIDKQRFLFNNAKMFNINDLVKLKKDIALRINAYYLNNRQQQDFNNAIKYFFPGIDTIAYTEQQSSIDKTNNLHVQLNINVNNAKQYLNNTLSADYNTGNNLAGIIANNNPVQQQLLSHIVNFTNSFAGVKVIGGNNILQYFSFTDYNKEPQTLHVTPGLNKEILNNSDSFKQAIQHATIPSFFTNNYITYYKPGEHFFQSYKAGFLYHQEALQSVLDIQQLNNTINLASDSFTNHLSWHKFTLYLNPEVRWEYDRNSFVLSAPVNNTIINYEDTLLGKSFRHSFFFITPFFKWQHKVGRESYVSAGYSYNFQPGSIEQVYYGMVMLDYRTFNSNNAPLQQTFNHNINAGFTFKKSLKVFFLNVFANYGFKSNNFIYSTLIQNNLTKQIALPFKNNVSSFNISSSLSKYIFALKTTLSLKYYFQYSHSQRLQNDILFPVISLSNFYSAGLRTKITEWLYGNYKVDYNKTITKADYGDNDFIQPGEQLKQQADIEMFPIDRLGITAKCEYYSIKQAQSSSKSFVFADFVFKYRLKKIPLSIELLCANITDLKIYSSLSVTANSISNFNYKLRPRTILATVSYDF